MIHTHVVALHANVSAQKVQTTQLMPLLTSQEQYPLHRLGWKAFQDLCVAVAEEVLKRPVQTFLPTADAGRDGAFVGTWDSPDPRSGTSTIQCKFTSLPDNKLFLSTLKDELEKARGLAQRGLAEDYVVLTNYTVTGSSELKIRDAFLAVGVGNCRVFHRDWIVETIRKSAKLRMLAPRLYGLGDLSGLLDERAYAQAQLILSELGDSVRRLVVTEAHRNSVRAIDAHNVVVLLGAPATGKSTIGAGLAIGAMDAWQCHPIKATSPQEVNARLDPDTAQFFWIDDAWGSTQYQRDRTEAWNQVFPLMQAAAKRGTRFLITSRDYIWNQAKEELKLQALPALKLSQVLIRVENFTVQEKAQIAYNHLKFGDQPQHFRETVKPFLPTLAQVNGFLPEVARRLGEKIFTTNLIPTRTRLIQFFEFPEEFLIETIAQLDAASKAALAVPFLVGGIARSPVAEGPITQAADAFGVRPAAAKEQFVRLNDSLLLLASDMNGPYWKYKHPTISDAFSRYVVKDPERLRMFLVGAKPETIAGEVVCAGVQLEGVPMIVPSTMLPLLLDRLSGLSTGALKTFMSYRASAEFNRLMLLRRPDALIGLRYFSKPIAEDMDVELLIALFRHKLLTEEQRLEFVATLESGLRESADSSFLADDGIRSLLNPTEIEHLLKVGYEEVLGKLDHHVERLRDDWNSDYSPESHFDQFRDDVNRLVTSCAAWVNSDEIKHQVRHAIERVAEYLYDRYDPPKENEQTTLQKSENASTPLDDIFRDIDE